MLRRSRWSSSPAASRRQAQSFPSRPVTIIAPTTAGGPPDTIARLLSERMRAVARPAGGGRERHRSGLVPSASGAWCARRRMATPVSIGHLNSHVFSPLSYNVPFDVLTDLAPVVMMTSAPMLFERTQHAAAERHAGDDFLDENAPPTTLGAVGVGGPATVWGAISASATASTCSSCPIAALPPSCRTWWQAR